MTSSDVDTHAANELKMHHRDLELHNQELREAQAQLEQARRRYAELFDLAPVGYCTVDERGRIEVANLTLAVMLGIERGRLIGKTLSSFLASKDKQAYALHLKGCFRDKQSVTIELDFDVKSRAPIVAQVVSTPVLNVRGAVTGCRTTLHDISRLKRSEELLGLLARASEILFSSFDTEATLSKVVHMAVPVFADACYLDLAVEGGMRRVEVAVKEELRRKFGPHFRNPGAPGTDSLQAQVLASKKPLFFPGLRRQGGPFERRCEARSLICVPVQGPQRIHGVVTLAMTDSGRSHTETDLDLALELGRRMALALENAAHYRAAQQAVQKREDILGVVSHDLRSPLGNMTLAISLLEGEASQDEREGALRVLQRASARMERMISDLLDFSSIEAGHLSVESEPHAVDQLLCDAEELLSPLAAARSQLLTFENRAGHRQVNCDRERILQVFSNLIGNAVKFTPEGGSIRVSAEASAGSHAHFRVSDDGPGIPEWVRDRVFDRFSQAQQTAHKGRGLGLFIARGIVEAMGGRLWFESVLGRGTTFHFTVPLAAERPSIVSVRDRSDSGSSRTSAERR